MVSSSSNTSVTCSPSCTVRSFLWASTRSRNALRVLAYCSRDMRLSAVIVPICVSPVLFEAGVALEPVSNADQRQWMLLAGLPGAEGAICDPLLYMAARDRAVRTYIVGGSGCHLAEDRPADFHRVREKFGLDPPGPVVPRATLHRVDLGLRHELEQLAGLQSHILHAQVARDVIRHFAQRRFEIGPEQSVPVTHDQKFEWVEHGLLHRLDVAVIRKHERQFLLEHQCARRH